MSTILVNLHGKVNFKVAQFWYEDDKVWIFFASTSSSLSIYLQINLHYVQYVSTYKSIHGVLSVSIHSFCLFFSLLIYSICQQCSSFVFICLKIFLIVYLYTVSIFLQCWSIYLFSIIQGLSIWVQWISIFSAALSKHVCL